MVDQTTAPKPIGNPIFDVDAARAQRDALDRPPELSIVDAVRHATAETGSGTAWLSGFWNCVNGPGKLTALEYFYYGLYDGFDADARLRYVGKKAQAEMHSACCDPFWFAPALDKLFFLSAMRGAGIPVPELLAVYDPTGRRSHERLITSDDGIAALLNQSDIYPLFAKPIDGMYSVGALAMTDGCDGTVHVRGAGNVDVKEAAGFMRGFGTQGYLLQRTLVPSVPVAEAFGGTLATVRFLVLMGENGPEIESAVVKIPLAENIADNYWRAGNMLGALDAETGAISRVVTGTGPELAEVSHHPETGVALETVRLPDWQAARAMCKRAAATLPGLRTQSWDIALTQRGPVVLEVNWGGDLNLHQLAHGRGAITSAFARHLRRNGYKGKLPVE